MKHLAGGCIVGGQTGCRAAFAELAFKARITHLELVEGELDAWPRHCGRRYSLGASQNVMGIGVESTSEDAEGRFQVHR